MNIQRISLLRPPEGCFEFPRALIWQPFYQISADYPVLFTKGRTKCFVNSGSFPVASHILCVLPHTAFQRGFLCTFRGKQILSGLVFIRPLAGLMLQGCQYIPEGTDFSEQADGMLADIEWKLDNRPRKSLGCLTPIG